MKRKIFTIAISVIALALVLLMSCNKTKTIHAERKSITEAVYASGFVVPKDEYKLYALADGYITAKLKDDGDEVKKGDAIYQVQNDATAAKLGASNSSLELAKMNASENSPVLTDLKNKIQNAEAKFKNDSLNYTRYKNMFDANAVTKTQFDQAELAYHVSDNDLKSARDAYRKTKQQVDVDVKNAQSLLSASNLDYSNYLVKSMMDGTVYETYKELGEAIRKNDLVALLGDKNHKLLQLAVDQQDIDKVKIGQEVVVKMDITGDKVYKARISKIYPNMNQADQSFKVEAEFSEEYNFGFVHASVEANIIIASKENALVIPKNVVQAGNEVELKGLGTNNKIKIKKGMENLEFVEVLEGVKESDEIIIPKEK